jgi:hypothetical protein
MENQDHIQKLIQQLVTNAQAIISHQIALPLGARKILEIKYLLDKSQSGGNIDLNIFYLFDAESDGLPIGSERLMWEQEALKKQDETLDKIIEDYKNDIINKCWEIIHAYNN